MSPETDAEIRQFFEGYSTAAIRDAQTFAACWEYPAHSTRFDQRTKTVEQLAITSRDEFIRSVEETDRRFRAWGFRTATVDVAAVNELADGLLQVNARWRFMDRSGECVADASALYTIGRIKGELRILQAIWLGLAPRARPRAGSSRGTAALEPV